MAQINWLTIESALKNKHSLEMLIALFVFDVNLFQQNGQGRRKLEGCHPFSVDGGSCGNCVLSSKYDSLYS